MTLPEYRFTILLQCVTLAIQRLRIDEATQYASQLYQWGRETGNLITAALALRLFATALVAAGDSHPSQLSPLIDEARRLVESYVVNSEDPKVSEKTEAERCLEIVELLVLEVSYSIERLDPELLTKRYLKGKLERVREELKRSPTYQTRLLFLEARLELALGNSAAAEVLSKKARILSKGKLRNLDIGHQLMTAKILVSKGKLDRALTLCEDVYQVALANGDIYHCRIADREIGLIRTRKLMQILAA